MAFVPLGLCAKLNGPIVQEDVERVPAITKLQLNDECKLRFGSPLDDAISTYSCHFPVGLQVTLVTKESPRLRLEELSSRS